MAHHAPVDINLNLWPMPTRLHVTRVLLGLTQSEMATKVATSHRTYTGWESGERPIPYRTWQYLVDRLGELLAGAELEQLRLRADNGAGYGLVNPIPAE